MALKQKLLETANFIDNKYLTLYCDLISKNLTRVREKYKTQAHHAIPCACYKNRKTADIDGNNFKVNLLFKDHIVAHYYLCLCAKESQIRYKMIAAIEFILGKSNNTTNAEIAESLKNWLLNDELYQQKYEEFAKIRKNRLQDPIVREKARQKLLGHATSDATRKKISIANTGRRLSAEHKQKLSEAHLGISTWNKGLPANNRNKVCLYDTKLDKVFYVNKDAVENYLAAGFIRGNPKCGRKDGSGTRNIKVVCIEINRVFNSIKEAAVWCNRAPSAIIQCLSGKSKTCGSYHWKYVD